MLTITTGCEHARHNKHILYMCVCMYTHTQNTHICAVYSLWNLYKAKLLMKPLHPQCSGIPRSTNCSTTKWKSKPSLSYSAVCGSGIKLCPCCHPPVGGARGCWRKPEGRQPSYLLSVPGSRTDAVAFEPELSRSFESPVVSILYEPLTIPSLPPLKSPNWQHTSCVLPLSIFVNNSKLLVSV